MQESFDTPRSLYHYTSPEGYKGILSSGRLNTSERGTWGAKHLVGQYFTDIPPERVTSSLEYVPMDCFSSEELAFELMGNRRFFWKFSYFIEVNVSEIPIKWCGLDCNLDQHIYVHLSENSLNISDKIIRYGNTFS
jgi:HYD1 signature containing ADP-ribosyltransferase